MSNFSPLVCLASDHLEADILGFAIRTGQATTHVKRWMFFSTSSLCSGWLSKSICCIRPLVTTAWVIEPTPADVSLGAHSLRNSLDVTGDVTTIGSVSASPPVTGTIIAYSDMVCATSWLSKVSIDNFEAPSNEAFLLLARSLPVELPLESVL
eukprot:7391622-Prymnesium_polylepis.2